MGAQPGAGEAGGATIRAGIFTGPRNAERARLAADGLRAAWAKLI